MAPPHTPEMLRAALLDRMDIGGPDECWRWTGIVNRQKGYPAYQIRSRTMFAHRAVYIAFVGPVAPGIHVHHECGNRMCVNPSHLHLMTLEEHARLSNVTKTHCPQGHEYNERNTYHQKDSGWRQCRVCNNERSKIRHAATRRAKKLAAPPEGT